jgi:crotonobetaine/carnitine-CoA ligase
VATGVGPQDLAAYCRDKLAAFKVPRFWQAEDDLPRTDSQRVAKTQLGQLRGAVFDAADGTWSSS